jgi:hypothetical protein
MVDRMVRRKEHSKIIRPIKNFRGIFAAKNDDRIIFRQMDFF